MSSKRRERGNIGAWVCLALCLLAFVAIHHQLEQTDQAGIDTASLAVEGNEKDILTFNTDILSVNDAAAYRKLLDIAISSTQGISVTWQDGLSGCKRIEGLDILIGNEIYQGWRCGELKGIHLDWRDR